MSQPPDYSNKVVVESCPVCGSAANEFCQDRLLLPQKDGDKHYRLRVARCGACGHHYQTLLWTEAQLRTYYQSETTYYRPDHSEIPPPSRARFNSVLADLAPHLQSDWTHLDVGGYSGHFSRFMRSHCGSSFCLDVCDHLQHAVENDVQVISKTLSDLAACNPDPAFDLITLNHTLEHLGDLEAARDSVCKLLRARGYLFIEVPYELEDDESIIDYTLDHTHYFTLNSLHTFLAGHFEVLSLKLHRYHKRVDVGQGFALKAVVRKREQVREQSHSRNGERGRAIVKAIEARIADSPEVYVWGSGYHTRLLFSMSNLVHEKTTTLIDSDKSRQGRTVFGKKVVHPSALEKSEQGCLVISSYDYCDEIEEIAQSFFHPDNIVNPYSCQQEHLQ